MSVVLQLLGLLCILGGIETAFRSKAKDAQIPYNIYGYVSCGGVISSSKTTKIQMINVVKKGKEDILQSAMLDNTGHFNFTGSYAKAFSSYNPYLKISGVTCPRNGDIAAAKRCSGNPYLDFLFPLPKDEAKGTSVTGAFEFIHFCQTKETDFRHTQLAALIAYH